MQVWLENLRHVGEEELFRRKASCSEAINAFFAEEVGLRGKGAINFWVEQGLPGLLSLMPDFERDDH